MWVSALVFVAEEMRLVDQHQQPKQVKWHQTGGEEIGGDTAERVDCFLVLVLLKQELFSPTELHKG